MTRVIHRLALTFLAAPRLTCRLLAGLLLAGLLAGCAVGGDYARPDMPVPDDFRGVLSTSDAAAIADTPWWELTRDPVLVGLIREALANNLDLKQATARVQEARARYGIARASLLPEAGASGGYTSERSSRLTDPPRGPFDRAFNNYDASVVVSWEIDLFGRNRRSTEAARASYLATEEGRRAAIVTLVADVASAYLVLRELDLQLEIARQTVGKNEETEAYYQKRLEGGLSNRLELDSAIANRARTAILVPDLVQQINAVENALSLLLGRAPGTIERGAPTEAFGPPRRIPAGLPAALLERRPDVRAAEQKLVAANADVGAAKALFFPSLSIAGALGSVSGDLSDLLDDDAAVNQLRPSLFAPIFQGGRIRANHEAAIARRDQALYQYRASALNAYREVSNALVATAQVGIARTELEAGVAALEDASGLARARYQEGLSSYLEILNADQQLLDQRLRLASLRADELRSVVDLYRALGGGWQSETPTMPSP
ncbi:MAG: efflux transporter outer membrane subunit [Gammaproteobacteria bacterium]